MYLEENGRFELKGKKSLSGISIKENEFKLVRRGMYSGVKTSYQQSTFDQEIQIVSTSTYKYEITWGFQSLAPRIVQLLE